MYAVRYAPLPIKLAPADPLRRGWASATWSLAKGATND